MKPKFEFKVTVWPMGSKSTNGAETQMFEKVLIIRFYIHCHADVWMEKERTSPQLYHPIGLLQKTDLSINIAFSLFVCLFVF